MYLQPAQSGQDVNSKPKPKIRYKYSMKSQ